MESTTISNLRQQERRAKRAYDRRAAVYRRSPSERTCAEMEVAWAKLFHLRWQIDRERGRDVLARYRAKG